VPITGSCSTEEALTPELADRLAALPRLDRANAVAVSVPCKICGNPAAFFDVVDFNKCAGFYAFGPAGLPVNWHRCDECGFLFTSFFDDWTDEDFRRFIYNEDYRLVDPEYEAARPVMVAEHLAQFLGDQQGARILDYGAGSGLFASRMKELGFADVEGYDPFSMPKMPAGQFDIVTCTEVIEHIPSPLAAVRDMRSLLKEHGCIILGETLQPTDIGALRGNWWYVAPRNGHVSTFADRTLAEVGKRLGLIFHRGSGHHVLRTPDAGALAEVAQRFGPAMSCFRLRAPAEEPAVGFHALELEAGRRFRWSAAEALVWQVAVPHGPRRLVQVTVPYMHESRRGFAAGCRIALGNKSASMSVRESTIVAEAGDIAPGPMLVTMRTPELSEPPYDPRHLGLAVGAA
jgi:SAM-dependent methyltransferase